MWEIAKSNIWNIINALAIEKWDMLVPISIQLPESLTRKKKLSVIISVVDSTSKNSENGFNSKHLDNNDSIEDRRKNGTNILNIRRAPIRKGLNIVVNLYTDSIENDAIDAIFPVPKNPILINIKKKLATLISSDRRDRVLNRLVETSS
jgi:hypothetical protein